MSLITVTKISKKYGADEVLSDVSFSIARGEKIALVGYNGTGKTTLLKMLAGWEKPDAGKIEIASGTRLGYLPQEILLLEGESVIGLMNRIFGGDILLAGILHDAKIILKGLGIDRLGFDTPAAALSGGQCSKLALAAMLLRDPDLLLLDEPTNNLDLPALEWLEDYLSATDQACLIVSHDRVFADKIVQKVFVIDWRTRELNVFHGNYSAYLSEEKRRLDSLKEKYRLEQEETRRLEEAVREKKADAAAGEKWQGTDKDKYLRNFKRDRAKSSARTARALEKRIERMDKTEKVVDRKDFNIPITADTGDDLGVLTLKDLVAGYTGGFLTKPISFEMGYGERVCLTGLNGSGKSTLLKTITGELKPLSGRVAFASKMSIGNLMQRQENLPAEQTLAAFLKDAGGLDNESAYKKLIKFGFSAGQANDKIKTLSPGGRARLSLAVFSARSVNFLVLDEPTNHLDLEALEALDETLSSYRGAVLAVSHDRYFIKKLSPDRIYELKDGMLYAKNFSN